MTKTKLFVAGALALAGTLAAGLAQARGADVQWSVTIGTPIGVPIYTQPVYEPVYQPAPVVVRPAPVYGVPVYNAPGYRDHRYHDGYRGGRGYREPTRWDRDGDGVPNRHDRVYNPRWDRDGDGVPNRHDRHPWGR